MLQRLYSSTLLRISITLTVAALCGPTVRGDDDQGRRERPDDAVMFDVQLTAEAQKRIDREINLLAKRVKEDLTATELEVLEQRIDRLTENLRDWSLNARTRPGSGESWGPFFESDRRHRKQGNDLTAPPALVRKAGGQKSVGQFKGFHTRQECSFTWSDSDGEFINEWSEETPLDEQYRVQVTGTLRLYLLVETMVNGKLMRAEGETKKKIFDGHKIKLKASEGEPY